MELQDTGYDYGPRYGYETPDTASSKTQEKRHTRRRSSYHER